MLIYLVSDQTLGINPDNDAGRFTVQMPEVFTPPKNGLTGGRWYLGLVDIAVPLGNSGRTKWDVMYVNCPQLEGSVVGDTYSPVLRSIPMGEIKRHGFARVQSVLYVPLRVSDVRHLSIELCDSRGKLLGEFNGETKNSTKCTLELIWKKDTNHYSRTKCQ